MPREKRFALLLPTLATTTVLLKGTISNQRAGFDPGEWTRREDEIADGDREHGSRFRIPESLQDSVRRQTDASGTAHGVAGVSRRRRATARPLRRCANDAAQLREGPRLRRRSGNLESLVADLLHRRVEAVAGPRRVFATERPCRVVVAAARGRADERHSFRRRSPAPPRRPADALKERARARTRARGAPQRRPARAPAGPTQRGGTPPEAGSRPTGPGLPAPRRTATGSRRERATRSETRRAGPRAASPGTSRRCPGRTAGAPARPESPRAGSGPRGSRAPPRGA